MARPAFARALTTLTAATKIVGFAGGVSSAATLGPATHATPSVATNAAHPASSRHPTGLHTASHTLAPPVAPSSVHPTAAVLSARGGSRQATRPGEAFPSPFMV